MPKMPDPRDYLDSGADNMPAHSENADAPGAKLLKDPGESDKRHSNKGYSVECDERDISPNASELGAEILEDRDEHPHSKKFKM